MKKYGLIASIILLLLVNAFVLIGVYYNRSGNTEAYIELTERELTLNSFDSFSYYLEKENSGLSLHLQLGNNRSYNDNSNSDDWLDQKKLEEIGFDCSVPLSSPKAKLHYGKMLPRKTFAVLEYEGKAWVKSRSDAEAYLKEMAQKTQRGEEGEKEYAKGKVTLYLKTASHLFAIDASNDPVSLRKKYKDVSRYIITPVKVSITFDESSEDCKCKKTPTTKKTQSTLSGNIREVLVNEIHVPPGKRQILESLLKKDGSASGRFAGFDPYDDNGKIRDPYYKIILQYGNRYEPWVADIKRIL